jgi:hypothetical protein
LQTPSFVCQRKLAIAWNEALECSGSSPASKYADYAADQPACYGKYHGFFNACCRGSVCTAKQRPDGSKEPNGSERPRAAVGGSTIHELTIVGQGQPA